LFGGDKDKLAVSQHLSNFTSSLKYQRDSLVADVGGQLRVTAEDQSLARLNTSRLNKDNVSDIAAIMDKNTDKEIQENKSRKIYVDEETAKRFKTLGDILKWAK